MTRKCPLGLAIWAAVSSKAQAGENKVSLESQEQQGREVAQALTLLRQ